MKMQHYTQLEWMQYVEESLPSEARNEMENHLYRCDDCLAIYMIGIEESLLTPIDIANTETYIKEIITRTIGTKPAWYRSTMFHYGVAAAATLVLVATGFFHNLSQELGTFGAFRPAPPLEVPASLEAKVPISDQLIHKTLTWLDTLQNDHKKGGLEP
ncbi:hypothetical protein [Paenibacillus qinlingensis]|uniref:Anti-sigma-YlaC factor YlaD n=1 Tax=Paenibacillus qinlingensis TaxID=1837343 RepID=A0ABU1P1R4_9BACL|nr:hypothetical protein [Paenibacillus qinlingensis]MDR6553691.1 putative anti-sigma-YlaC factor YlaD [Paenibacillus qinlingensis]